MIQIKPTKLKNGKSELTKKEAHVFRAIGAILAEKPIQLFQLLQKHGFEVGSKMSHQELGSLVISVIAEQNQEFNYDLAQLIIHQESEYDTFFKKASGSQSSPINVGADPVSAVAGAIGSIFSFAGSLQNQKAQKKQARKETLFGMMNSINQKEEAQRASVESAKQQKLYWRLGILTATTITVGLFIWQHKRISPTFKLKST